MSLSKIIDNDSLVKNPFICNSFTPIRLAPNQIPENKIGNTKYITTINTDKGVILDNHLDPKLSYIIPNTQEEGDEMINTETSSIDKYDYEVPAEVLNKIQGRDEGDKIYHKEGLPLSFIQIKTEEDGIEWYKEHYPKIPDDLLGVIARYHWGQPITKKGLKNEKKKIEKKLKSKGLEMKTSAPNNPFILDFN